MSVIDYATAMANRDETIRRLVVERDELREIVSGLGMYVIPSDMDDTTRTRWAAYNRKQKEIRPNG